jgi:type I restriction enzyme M protein
MLTQDTKKHIDAARQILVGVVPNPMSQVEQITNALIYKFMDDMDQQAIKAGGDPSFFVKDLEKYAWTKVMDSRLGNQERMNLYSEALIKFSEAKQLPPLFRDIFKQAFLPYRDPEVLGLFLKEISYFDYTHSEELGNAYEYLLSIMSSQGDAGQFRTPRHIIDFIVDVLAPTKDDTILDPACGTAGFLISAYNHIKRQNEGVDPETGKMRQLTADERRKLVNNFEGYDVDPTMVRMSQVNMYLHKFTTPKIYNYNTLASEDRWNDKFDLILANPPFMSPKGGIKPHNKFSVQANRAEVLFVDYIMNHLKPKGRAGIIVPEGIIFQSGKAYKELRKNLVNDGLFAVVSLPAGVFNPYSGVKTSILFFDNEVAKKTKDLLFVKVTSDGYNLGAQRRKIEKDDLGDAGVILKGFRTYVRNGENQETIESFISGSGKGFIVSKEKIAETDDYNLSADRYKIVSDFSNLKYETVKLGDICTIKTGKKDVNQGNPDGEYPFFTCARDHTFSDSYSFDTEALLIAGNGDVGHVQYFKGKFEAYQRTYILSDFKDNADIKFIYYYLSNKLKPILELQKLGNTMPYIKLGMLTDFEIPLPPIEVQKEIVEQIEVKQKAIEGAKQVIENLERERRYFGQSLRKLEGVDMIPLDELCEIGDGNHSSNYPKSTEMVDSGIPFIRATNISNLEINPDDMKFITTEKHKILKKGHLKENDIIFSNRGEIGKVAIVDKNFDGVNLNSQLAWLRSKESILPKYLLYILNSNVTQNQIKLEQGGATLQQYTIKQIKELRVPVPSIDIQRSLVLEMESGEEIVKSNKKLIELMEKKIEEVLSEI